MSAAESTVVSDDPKLKAIKRIEGLFSLLALGGMPHSTALFAIAALLDRVFLNSPNAVLNAQSLKNNFNNAVCGDISRILEYCIDPSNRIHPLSVYFNFRDYGDDIFLCGFVEGRGYRSNPIPMELIANLLRNDESLVKIAEHIAATEIRFEERTHVSEHHATEDEDYISRGPTF